MTIVKDEVSRWYVNDAFIKARENIIKSLNRGKKLNGLTLYNGYADLRCLKLNELTDKEKQVDKLINIKANVFHKIDFSEADLSNSTWSNCEFIDCRFNGSVFYNVTFKNCSVKDTDFIKCKFKHSDLGRNILKKSGLFSNVNFKECFLKYVNFCFPLFDKCSFINCEIEKVDFDGSRFSNSVFAGEIEAADFSGYSSYASTSLFGLIKWFNADEYKNYMENVDFSKAQLKYVGFSHGIDLTKCKFPVGENYLIVNNPGKVYTKAQEIINTKWHDSEKELADDYINMFLNPERKKNMRVDFLIRHIHHRNPVGFDEKLFELIRSINEMPA